ncbi:hypothetical protein HDU96_004597 [Phlyctochytrium bullatum]|nr:hypothetical protein HDU96_004597 [Phlyctochytrium bullatum]
MVTDPDSVATSSPSPPPTSKQPQVYRNAHIDDDFYDAQDEDRPFLSSSSPLPSTTEQPALNPTVLKALAIKTNSLSGPGAATEDAENTPRQSFVPSHGKVNIRTAGKAVLAAQQFRSSKRQPHDPDAKLTAAQAMSRVTGTIFDSDDQIPLVLRAPLVAAVEASDTLKRQLATYREAVNGLVYWEALTNSLYVTFALTMSYVIGWLGFSFAWALLLLLFFGNAFRRNLAQIRRHVAVETTRNLAIRRLETESETAEWLNKFVQRFWIQLEPSLSVMVKASLEPSLAPLTMPVFTLGSASPRFEIIRTIARTSDDVHLMDMDLNFTPVDEDDFSKREKELGDIRNSRIEVKFHGVPILVSNIEFSGKLRIGIKYMTKYPHIKLVEYSFLEPPLVNFKLRPLKGIDLMDSGISSTIKSVINSSLACYVEPNKQHFDVEAFFNGTSSDAPVGVLKITIFEARDLKNVELGGVSDPYAVVKIAGKEVARTSTIDQSLSPYWGETYYIPVLKSYLDIPADLSATAPRPDALRIHILDKNDTLTDKSMGCTETLPLAQFVKLLEAAESERAAAKAAAAAKALADSNPGSPVDIRGKVSGDKVLSRAERNRLITEWGTPFPEDSDVWKPVMHEEKGKAKGELRVDLCYYPLPKPEIEELEVGDVVADAEGDEALDPAVKKAREKAKEEAAKIREQAAKARAEMEAKLTTGVLTATVHQAKELACGKSANPWCQVALRGLERGPVSPSNVLGATDPARKTNNPVWEKDFVFFVADTEAAELLFTVKDGERTLGTVLMPVKEAVEKKPGADAAADWYKFPGSGSGKVRITFKWQPLDMENAHKNAEVVRKEPIGMIRINVLGAKGVANVEAFRKSDPYAKIQLSRRTVGATHVKENTLDPVWNELFYAVCYSRNEPIRIELFDYNKVKKDLGLGRVDFYLEELLNPDSWQKGPEELMFGEREVGGGEGEQDGMEGAEGELGEAGGEEMDMKRLNWLSRQKEHDGLKVTRNGNVMDVWAPIYITRSQNEDVEDAKETSGSRTLNAPPLLSASTTALNMVGVGSGAKPGQKGHLHFEIELLEVVGEHYVRPKTTEELWALVQLRQEAAKVEEERKAILAASATAQAAAAAAAAAAQAEKGTEAEGEERKVVRGVTSMTDLLKNPDAEEAHQLLLGYLTPFQVVNTYSSGIIRLRVHEVRQLKTAGSYYTEILVDDELVGSTRVQRRIANPIWDTSFDLFMKNVKKQKIKIQLRCCAGDDMKKASGDSIVAVWDASIVGVVGLRNAWVEMHPNGWKEGVAAEMRVSVGYAPILQDSDEDGSKNMGVLYVDIVDAANLEAVDSSGTSDPYCIISLNDRPVHKTKVHKKQCNPTFNEILSANVKSRYRSSLTITVRDHNTIGKHTTLGTVTLQLSKIGPEVLYVALLPLEGARGGFIRIRLLFVPQILDESAFDEGVDRADKKEENRFAKFTKGLGSSAVGAIASSIDTIGGRTIPVQAQGGPTAEELARTRKCPVKMLGDAPVPVASAAGEEASRSRGLESSQSLASMDLRELILERQRSQLFGSVQLRIEAARNLKPVDAGGTSDPYVKVVQLVHGKEKVLLKTKVLKKTLDPVWHNEHVTIRVPPTTVRLLMKDKNMFAESKPMGEVDLDFTHLLKDGKTTFDAWFPLGLGGKGEVHVSGTYTPEVPRLMTSGPTANGSSSTSSLRERSASHAGSVASLAGATTNGGRAMSRASSRSSVLVGSRESLVVGTTTTTNGGGGEDDPEGRLSPSMSVASSVSSLNEAATGGGERRERKRVFSFVRRRTEKEKSGDKE